MKRFTRDLLALTVILLLLAFGLSGCVSLRTWFSGHQQQIGATGSYLAQKAGKLALQIIISSAQSPQDANKKADYLDSLAYGVRTVDKSTLIGTEDFVALAGIWAPDKPHWAELGTELGTAFTQSSGPSEQRLEMIAQGLNQAAAQTRLADAAP